MTLPAFVSNVVPLSCAATLSTSWHRAGGSTRHATVGNNSNHPMASSTFSFSSSPRRKKRAVTIQTTTANNGAYRLGWHGQHGRLRFEPCTIRSCMSNPPSSSSSPSSSTSPSPSDPIRPASFTVPTKATPNSSSSTNNQSNNNDDTKTKTEGDSDSDSDSSDIEVLDTDLGSLGVDLPLCHPSITDADRAAVDTMAADGAQLLDDAAASVRSDIDSAAAASNQLADRLIEEETSALLDKFESRQRELLDAVDRERDVIREEVEALQSRQLLFGKEGGGGKEGKKREGLLQGVIVLFGIGATSYAVSAVMNSDAAMMTNALLDAGVAVCAAFFLSRQTESLPSSAKTAKVEGDGGDDDGGGKR